MRTKWVITAISLFCLVSSVGGFAGEETLEVATGQLKGALARYIQANHYDMDLNDQHHKIIEPIRLHRLGVSCNGSDLYLLDLEKLRFRVEKEVKDLAGISSGSGGTQTPILAWNQKKINLTELSSDPVLAWELPQPGEDCPRILVLVHHSHYEGVASKKPQAYLEYQKASQKYEIRVRGE